MFRADMEYIANYMKLESFNALRPCLWCQANEFESETDRRLLPGEMPRPWNDVSHEASWRHTCWAHRPHQEWLDDHEEEHRHVMFSMPGFSVNMFVPDELHVLDLGVFSRVCANTIFNVVFDGMERGRSNAQRLNNFWKRCLTHYDDPSKAMSTLTMGMFCTLKAPRSNQPAMGQVKAAEIRYLLPAVHLAFEELADHDDDIHVLIIHALSNISNFLAALDGITVMCPLEETALYLESCLQHVVEACGALAVIYNEKGEKRWGTVPKHHFAIHLAQACHWVSPRAAWTYIDESYLQVIKRIVEACAKGTKPRNMCTKAARKWALGFDVRCEMFHPE